MPHNHHPPPPPTPNPTYLAITESISLHKYHVQNTILTLLSLPVVPWESLIPPPRVSLEQAEEHVRGVRRGCGVREDGGCEGQEQGEEQREEQGEDRGKVLDVEEEARRVVERLKTEEQETGTAASILVELDEHPYKLILPDLDQLTNDQRTALALHARHTRIIDALRARLRGVEVFVHAAVPAPPSAAAVGNHPAPTATATPTATYQQQQPPPPPPPHQRLRTIARLLPRFIGAAIKIEIALWMITRSLHPSSDWRYWAFVLAGVGWWVWECVGVYRVERERGRVVREREREREVRVPQEGQDAVGRPVPPAVAVDPGNRQQQQQQQQQPAAPRRTRGHNNRHNTRPNPLPFLGLAYERRLLRLFYLPPSSSNSHPTTTTPPTNPHRIPTKDTNLPLAPRDPSIAWTYLFIPMYVCVLSLWPAGEAARRRAIREREGDMRALSARLGEGVAVAVAEAEAGAEGQRRAREQQREGAGQGASEDGTPSLSHDPTQQQQQPLPTPTTTTPATTTDAATTTATATAPSVIPRNLSPASERYWRRVLARGETIDWDEERAAQERVLGAAAAAGRGAGGGGAGQDEDAQAGGLGMGMGLW